MEEEEEKSFLERGKKLSALLHYVLKGKEIAFTYQDEMVYVGSACCDIWFESRSLSPDLSSILPGSCLLHNGRRLLAIIPGRVVIIILAPHAMRLSLLKKTCFLVSKYQVDDIENEFTFDWWILDVETKKNKVSDNIPLMDWIVLHKLSGWEALCL